MRELHFGASLNAKAFAGLSDERDSGWGANEYSTPPTRPKGDLMMLFSIVRCNKFCQIVDRSCTGLREFEALQSNQDIFWLWPMFARLGLAAFERGDLGVSREVLLQDFIKEPDFVLCFAHCVWVVILLEIEYVSLACERWRWCWRQPENEQRVGVGRKGHMTHEYSDKVNKKKILKFRQRR